MGKRLFWSRDRLIKHEFDCLGFELGLRLWLERSEQAVAGVWGRSPQQGPGADRGAPWRGLGGRSPSENF